MAYTSDQPRTSVTLPSDTEIVIERTLQAPPAVVWSAWDSADHLGKWWGPDGFTMTTKSFDFRPGGQWRYVMHGPDGTDYPNLITYLEIDEPNRIVYKLGGDVESEPVNFVTEVEFIVLDDLRTKVTMHMSFPDKEARDFVIREYNAAEGGKQHLANLEAYVNRLDHGREQHEPVVVARVFDAPRSLVWKAWTRQEHLARWFGPKQVELSHCSLDLRVGGMMHYCMVGLGCEEHWGRWIFREISEPDRLVFVVSFADRQGNPARAFFDERWPLEMLTTVTFSEHAGKGKGTLVTMESEPINATDEERGVFYAGRESMRGGWGGTFDKLASFLANNKM
ncbi:MAG: SRPBCC domain-containing protein [Phycisphaerales bacterium]|nr:SRPBCC domain-containing protein [Phycisphaerales bacterium]